MNKILQLKILIVLTIFFGICAHAQEESFKEILRSGGNDFLLIQKNSESYFNKKNSAKSLTSKSNSEETYSYDKIDKEYVRYKRWESVYQDRLDENGQVIYRNALSSKKSVRPSLASRSVRELDGVWQDIGNTRFITTQIGLGRTISIGFHPTDPLIFYVGAAQGGVWKTTDGGQTYIPLGDELPHLSVSGIVVNKENPDIIHIAVSDHVWYGPAGTGIFKSIDGGLSWQPTIFQTNIQDNIRILWLEVNPFNDNDFLIATEAGLYRTLDGFETVNLIPEAFGQRITDVKFNRFNGDIYYTNNQGQFFRSTDNGISFTSTYQATGANAKIAISYNGANNVAILSNTVLHRSSDAGQTFTNTYEGYENNGVFAMSAQNDDIIISGNFEVQRSDEGGSNNTKIADWLGRSGLPLVHVDQRNMFINPLEPEDIYICNDGGVFKYNVPENAFTDLSDGLGITQYYDIATSQSLEELVSGGSQDNGSMFLENDQWQEFAGTGDGMNTEIDVVDPSIRYFAYQLGGLNRWLNGRATPIKPVNYNGAWETPYQLHPTKPTTIVAGYRQVFRSEDRGNNWVAISEELANGNNLEQLTIAPSNPEVIYTSQYQTLYRKSEENNDWTSSRPDNPGFARITDIGVDFEDENLVYVAYSGYIENRKIFKTSDGGNTWENISYNLPNSAFKALEVVQGTGGVLVGSNNGVYYLAKGTETWIEIGDAPNVAIQDIEINYENRSIYLGTHGRGLLKTSLDILDCAADSCGCNSTTAITPFIRDELGATANTFRITACYGSTIGIGTQDGLTDLTLKRPDGSKITNEVGTTFFDINVTDSSDQGVYIISYTNSQGCTDTQNYYVQTVEPFEILPYVRTENTDWIEETTISSCLGENIYLGTILSLPNALLTRPDGTVNNITDGDTYFIVEATNTDLSGTYTLSSGCSNIDFEVVIHDPLVVEPMTATEVICGSAVQLSPIVSGGSGDYIYNWSPTTYLSDPNIENPFATPLENTVYTLTVTDSSGCSSITSQIRVEVLNGTTAPVLVSLDGGNLIPADDVLICNGTDVLIDLEGTIEPVDIFNFTRPDGMEISGGLDGLAADQILLSNMVDESALEGEWLVTQTSQTGCSKSSNFVLNVISRPQVTYEVTSQSCSGGSNSITFTFQDQSLTSTIELSINGGVDYQTVNDNSGTLTITDVSPGTYELMARWNEDSCAVIIDTVEITNQETISFANAGEDVSICEGETATLTASGGNQYLWSTGETTQTISVTQAGTYTVTATSAGGCTDSDTVNVSLATALVANAGEDVSICEGETANLTASGGNQYLWSTGETTQTISVTQAGTYTVTATNAGGCTDSDTVNVSLVKALVADAGEDVSICEGETATLTASGGNQYLWSTGETTQTISVTQAGTYTVTATNAGGCTDSDTVNVIIVTPFILFRDKDEDGFGDLSDAIESCESITGYVSNTLDCNDEDPLTYPGADEVPNDGIDQDCDGSDVMDDITTENGVTILYPNPANTEINLSGDFLEEGNQVRVYSSNGRLILDANVTIEGYFQHALPILANGWYLVKIDSLSGSKSIPFLVIKE